MKKESLSVSMSKLIIVVSLIVCVGAMFGMAGYYLTKYRIEPMTNNLIKNETVNICPSTVTDIDNNIYNTVKIGDQCWIKENLKVTKNPVGVAITRYCYDNDLNICDTDGGLYDWNTAMNSSMTEGTQGICPNGWHIPKDSEWHILENYLTDKGQTCRSPKSLEWDCETAGTKLKIEGSSGFSGILTGERDSNGLFLYQGGAVDFWSSTEFIPPKMKNDKEIEKVFGSNGNYKYALIRGLSSWSSVSRNMYKKVSGLSIRCLKD